MRLIFRGRETNGGRGWGIHPKCGLDACTSTLLTRSFQSRAGVSVGRQWYCSTHCFSVASKVTLAALSDGKLLEMPHSPRLSIGLLLLSKGYLTDDQLRAAKTESEATGETMETTLVRVGQVSERAMVAAKAAQWGCPVFSGARAATRIESDIPPSLLRRSSAAPLHYSTTANRLLLGFVHRVDHSLLSSLELVTGIRTEPCFITPTEYREQTGRATTAANYEEVVFEDHQTLGQMAKNVGGFAQEIAAGQAVFARCRDYVWARLSGKKSRIDLLFRIENAPQTPRYTTAPMFSELMRSSG